MKIDNGHKSAIIIASQTAAYLISVFTEHLSLFESKNVLLNIIIITPTKKKIYHISKQIYKKIQYLYIYFLLCFLECFL